LDKEELVWAKLKCEEDNDVRPNGCSSPFEPKRSCCYKSKHGTPELVTLSPGLSSESTK